MTPTVLAVSVILVACVVALGLGVWAHRHAQEAAFNGTTKVGVHESSYHVRVAETALQAGKIGFDVHNDASVEHEFVVFETELPADRLPLGKDGDVIEDSPQLHNAADSGSSIRAHGARAVITDLAPGHYALVCNLPGHYHLGMHTDLDVS
jgi:uncharacterized cupredoxin-like copper-binding protein